MRARLLLVFAGVVALVLLVHDVPLARHLQRVERDRLVTQLERDAFVIAGHAEEGLEDGTVADQSALQALVAATRWRRGSMSSSWMPTELASRAVKPATWARASRIGRSSSRHSRECRHRESASRRRLGRTCSTWRSPCCRARTCTARPPQRTRVGRRSTHLRAAQGAGAGRVDLACHRGRRGVAVRRVGDASDPPIAGDDARVSNGDLGVRADDGDGPPEVRDLAVSFNAMAARLESLIERQRSFAGTASHQLRTPLTALRLRLDQLAASGELPSESEHHVEAALAETDRLRRMIEGLLALSRAEGVIGQPITADLAKRGQGAGGALGAVSGRTWCHADCRHTRTSSPIATLDGALEQIIDNLVRQRLGGLADRGAAV